MRTFLSKSRALGLGAMIGLTSMVGFAQSPADPLLETFNKDCAEIAKHPHRLTGTKEYLEAAQYIQKRLESIVDTQKGDQIIVQEFESAQIYTPTIKEDPNDYRNDAIVPGQEKEATATISANGKTINLFPMRPNGIIPPATPRGGLTGKITYIGKGNAEDFNKINVKDHIVVLNYNSGQGFIRAFRLGAKAVIFTNGDQAKELAMASSPHFADCNVNLMRYYFNGTAAELKKSFAEQAEVKLDCKINWGHARGRNVIAYIKGTNPTFDEEKKKEVIVIAVNLDTFGEVPNLSKGARGAANAAALLRIAGHIAKNRIRRDVIVAFFDNQARGHLGVSQFYRAIEDKKDNQVTDRRQNYINEANFMDLMDKQLASDSPLTMASDVRKKLLDKLEVIAQKHAYFYKNEAYEKRENLNQRKKAYSDEIPQELLDEEQALNKLIREELEPKKMAWNEVQRTVGREKRQYTGSDKPLELDPELSAEEKAMVEQFLKQVLAEAKAEYEERKVELKREDESLTADETLYAIFNTEGDERTIVLHTSLLLGDTTDKWAIIIGGDSSIHSSDDNQGLYGKVRNAFLNAYKSLDEHPIPNKKAENLFLVESADQKLNQTRVIWAAPRLVHSGELAGVLGYFNLAIGTVQEGTLREGTPDDTLENLDELSIYKQARDIERYFAPYPETSAESIPDMLGNQEGLSLNKGFPTNKEYFGPIFDEDNNMRGPTVMGMLPGTSTPNTPLGGAIVQLRLTRNFSLAYNESKFVAFDNYQVVRTDANGHYSLGPLNGRTAGSWGGFAAVFRPEGNLNEVSALSTYAHGTIRYRLNTFKARNAYIVLPSQQRTEKLPGEDVKILSAKANADLVNNRSFSETVDGIVAWYSDERERAVKAFSLRQVVAMNNGPEQKSRTDKSEAGQLQEDGTDKYVGVGFEMTDQPISVNAAARSASDLWRINDSRLDILRSKGILDSSLAELHGRSEDMLNLAADSNEPMAREALNTFSLWSSRPVYLKVRTMLDDLVFAVLILLGLSVPFAFALERVIVGAVIIYKQITWFVVFFAMTFVLLYLTHPAFAIANTPIIIFLGFAIVVMSCMVIFIIMRKFEVELKAMQGMTATVHVNDVSNITTFMAAMQMGISTMRRRPTRTALTAITIILLTFTILCFASFGTQSGIVTISVAPNPKYNGAFVHNVNWNPLSEDLKDMITYSRVKSETQSGDAIRSVCKRLWISPKTQDNPGLLLSKNDGSMPITIRGVLGIEPEELNEREEFREYFEKIDDDSILITQPVAEYLGVKEGENVILKGRTFKVGKIYDNVKVSAAKDMDTSSILPADFTEMTANQPASNEGDEELDAMSQRNWSSIAVDQVVIVSANSAKLLGGNLYALMVYTDTTQQAVAVAEELARVLNIPIPATRENGVERHLLGSVLKASGAKDLFFPIVLGGLVIFGTMLGSVADRKKEIYTFSALGLAPKHVATLFFAESMVYALIGGLGGYLLAQGTLKILGILAEYGIVRVPEMNMSSTNTIVTILIVMATVLISSIYPAVKASKSANPGLMRIWRPPKPEGDVMDLVFPFTVSQYDITGVLSFLKEHFANHTDTGLGQFMTSSVELVKDKNTKDLGLDAKLALAPFDLGVSQFFSLRSTPSEIEGIDEVRVILSRSSGQPKDWQRLNKVFLDDLRQQFLIWRSVPKDTMEMYRQRTLTSVDGITEVVTPPKKVAEAPAEPAKA